MLLEHQFVENRSKEKSGECTPLFTTQITVNLTEMIMFGLRIVLKQIVYIESNFATLLVSNQNKLFFEFKRYRPKKSKEQL